MDDLRWPDGQPAVGQATPAPPRCCVGRSRCGVRRGVPPAICGRRAGSGRRAVVATAAAATVAIGTNNHLLTTVSGSGTSPEGLDCARALRQPRLLFPTSTANRQHRVRATCAVSLPPDVSAPVRGALITPVPCHLSHQAVIRAPDPLP